MPAAMAPDPEAHPAHGVLPEVDERPSRGRGPYPLGRKETRRPDRRTLRSDEVSQVLVEDLHLCRTRRTVAEPQVGRLAVVEVVRHDLTLVRPPGPVRSQDVDGAVGGDDLELGQQGEAISIESPGVGVAEPAAVPPVPEQRLDDVRTRLDQVRHVVGVVSQPVRVGRPSGGENRVVDPSTVDRGLVDAVRRGVEPGPLDLAGHLDPAGQNGRSLAFGSDTERGDEAGIPVAGTEETRLDGRPITPRAPARPVGDPHADLGALAGVERWCWPRDQHLLPALDAEDLGRPVPHDLDLVGRLLPAGVGLLDGPRQARRRRSEAEHRAGIGAVLEAWSGGCRG